MTPSPWVLSRTTPPWLEALQPATTGFLGQDGLKLWVAGERAAIAIRAGGVVYPVLVPEWNAETAEGSRAVFDQVGDAWCLMGPTPWVRAAEPLMPRSVVTHRVEYEFLVRPANLVAIPAGPGTPRQAEPSDGNALYPLQEGYEKEEVLFDSAEFQPLGCRLHLGKLLRTQEIVGLWENGKPIAKAGTNALTKQWAQIGGVYTRPEHRGRGLQKRLMAFLLDRLTAQGRSSCLFVKTGNVAALALYRGLGYQADGGFQITYGHRGR